MSLQLKIKYKSITEETKIIRSEERKLQSRIPYLSSLEDKTEWYENTYLWSSLNYHRRFLLKNENRATALALGYLLNKKYSTIENYRKPQNENEFFKYVIPKVTSMINRYSDKKITEEDVKVWCSH